MTVIVAVVGVIVLRLPVPLVPARLGSTIVVRVVWVERGEEVVFVPVVLTLPAGLVGGQCSRVPLPYLYGFCNRPVEVIEDGDAVAVGVDYLGDVPFVFNVGVFVIHFQHFRDLFVPWNLQYSEAGKLAFVGYRSPVP